MKPSRGMSKIRAKKKYRPLGYRSFTVQEVYFRRVAMHFNKLVRRYESFVALSYSSVP